ncbi:transcriptional repressor LexA [Sporosarcina sp. FSL K6-2383]|uniref:transcriptional repressor LexA n=1 Tax=Sporosarcina sp. FSL K6-2383 TaxID=2921556 RepID=UPI00315A7E2D
MSFNKEEFSRLLELAKGARSINQYAMHSGISAAHISRLMRSLLDTPPNPDTIKLLAEKAYNEVTYTDLMGAAGHFGEHEAIKEDNAAYVTKLNPVIDFFRIPLLGHIAAGEPIFAAEHIEDYIDIPSMGDYDPDELFMLKVKGDSMVGSRIYEGDRVIVKMQPEVENGEIAVVNVNGDEATLKKVKKLDNGQTLLIASNDKYEPILVNHESARIVGKVIQVIFEP